MRLISALYFFATIFFSPLAMAEEGANSGDTTWIIVATALVMLMTPGLAFFYSGMVHNKNVVATILHSFMKLCAISVIWILWGYTLAFGDSVHGLIGDFSYLGLSGVSTELAEGTNIPHLLFILFQGMFAVITAAIITGAFAERVRLGPVLLFATIWITVVYAPVAHWVWGGGWIVQHFEALDFAGGAVVHVNSAVAGLVAAIFLGKRNNFTPEVSPHNTPLMILGCSLLWFGWFGFNAGSALAADNIAVLALVNTNVAAASGAMCWFFIELMLDKRASALGVVSGSIAGLVAITPAAGFVTPLAAILIGAVAGGLCLYAVVFLKPRLGYDDSLDVFGIHGIGGLWGALATGLFATTAVNPAGANGLFYGNPELMVAQIVSSLVIIAYSAAMTYIVLKLVRKMMPIRVRKEEEDLGLDIVLHGDIGYKI